MPLANKQSTGKASGTQMRKASAARACERRAALRVRVAFDEKDQTGILAKRKVYAPVHHCASVVRGIAGRFFKTPSAAGNYEKWPQKCGGL